MITVISGTNRRGSECLRFATYYAEQLRDISQEEVKLLALEDIPHDWFSVDMYTVGAQSDSLIAIQDEYILPAQKFVFFISEYNGSYPGALKLFIDAVSVRHYRQNFSGKKAALIGVASGRAGNLLGMDHLTAVLHHLGCVLLPHKLPISRIEQLLDAEGHIQDDSTRRLLRAHGERFAAF